MEEFPWDFPLPTSKLSYFVTIRECQCHRQTDRQKQMSYDMLPGNGRLKAAKQPSNGSAATYSKTVRIDTALFKGDTLSRFSLIKTECPRGRRV